MERADHDTDISRARTKTCTITVSLLPNSGKQPGCLKQPGLLKPETVLDFDRPRCDDYVDWIAQATNARLRRLASFVRQ